MSTDGQSLAQQDFAHCIEVLKEGSKSFYAASLLLPPALRGKVAAIYAFCRIADDAVDETSDPAAGLRMLNRRLDAIYAGTPEAQPIDRAISQVALAEGLPRQAFEGLFEGFAWDVEGRRYETLDELIAYCVRVASTVGVLMTVVMGRRDPIVLARACDLGIAMQLTNIARDVGEDAREGRLYLPEAWLREVGIEPDAFLANPAFSAQIGLLVRRLLAEADRYYERADVGIAMLPRGARLAIQAARLIYADIGRVIEGRGYDSVSSRAYTSPTRKAELLGRAMGAMWSMTSAPTGVAPATQARFLVQSF